MLFDYPFYSLQQYLPVGLPKVVSINVDGCDNDPSTGDNLDIIIHYFNNIISMEMLSTSLDMFYRDHMP